MKTSQIELLKDAMSDQKLEPKFFEIDDYMKFLDLSKKISDIVDEQSGVVNKLIDDYNKDFNEKVKTPEYKQALKKKEEEKELTPQEEELLALKPTVVVLRGGMVQGPSEFIEKVNKIREKEYKLVGLKFVKDKKVFKQVVENLPPSKQVVLFQHLLK